MLESRRKAKLPHSDEGLLLVLCLTLCVCPAGLLLLEMCQVHVLSIACSFNNITFPRVPLSEVSTVW